MAKGFKTGGRQAGTPNKMTATLKDMLLVSLDKAGGIDYLVRQSAESPQAFMTLLGKIVPSEVRAQVEGNLTVISGVPRADG